MPSRAPAFRLSFTLMLVYVAGFFLFYALLFALPDLLSELQRLEPSSGPLTPEELERAKQVSHEALRGGKVLISLVAAVATTGLALWRRVLPGVR